MRALSNVQVLRGIAALLVVLSHIPDELVDRGLRNPLPDLSFGAFGVDIFFVISGFIMVYASAPSFGAPGASLAFVWRRLARILPLYWTFTALFAAIALATPQPGAAPASLAHIAASFLFVPWPQPSDGDLFPIYPLGWTLNYEMFFYACFALVLPFRRTAAVVLLSSALAAFVVLRRVVDVPLPYDYWGNPQVLEFVFGMLIAEAFLRGARLPRPLGWLLVGIAAVAVLASAPSIESWLLLRGLVWGVPAALVVAAGALVESRPAGQARRAAEALGDASYSLYLVHYALFAAVAFCLPRLVHHPERVPPLLYGLVLLLGSIAVAILTFRFFERPVTRLLQGRPARAGPHLP